MRPRLVGVGIAGEDHRGVAHQRRLPGLQRSKALIDAPQGSLQRADHLLGARERGPLGQQDARLDDVAVEVGKADKLELAACRHGDCQDDQHDHHAQREVAVVDRAVQQRTEAALAQCIEALLEFDAKSRGRLVLHA